MNDFARLRRIKTQSDLESVVAVARAENHVCFDPTHAIWKGGNIVGHVSVCAMPAITGHLPMGLSPRDSFNLFTVVEDIASQRFNHVYVPVAKESPFHPLMEGMGFANLVNVDLFYKELKA
jgi:hypothetical protein